MNIFSSVLTFNFTSILKSHSSFFPNVFAFKKSSNVCLLKEEKLLIEKLTLIIGGFYQQSKKNFSCLIKYLNEGEREGKSCRFRALLQGLRDCLFMSNYCVLLLSRPSLPCSSRFAIIVLSTAQEGEELAFLSTFLSKCTLGGLFIPSTSMPHLILD